MLRPSDPERRARLITKRLTAAGVHHPEPFVEALIGMGRAPRTTTELYVLFQLGVRTEKRTTDRLLAEFEEREQAGEPQPIRIQHLTPKQLQDTKISNDWLIRAHFAFMNENGTAYSVDYMPGTALTAPPRLNLYSLNRDERAFRAAEGVIAQNANGNPGGRIRWGIADISSTIDLPAPLGQAEIGKFVSKCETRFPDINIPFADYTAR